MSKLDSEERDHLSGRQFAFLKEHDEPLEDASHVRNAIARFDQVTGVGDDERDEHWERTRRQPRGSGSRCTNRAGASSASPRARLANAGVRQGRKAPPLQRAKLLCTTSG